MGKILVVDDDKAMTEALAIRLRAASYEVFTANGSEEAAAIALHERPALIVLDIDMPPYSGLEFQECLRFAERGRDIPIIIMSGQDSQRNRLVAFQQGARGFIKKPIQWPTFLQAVRNVTEPEAAPARLAVESIA